MQEKPSIWSSRQRDVREKWTLVALLKPCTVSSSVDCCLTQSMWNSSATSSFCTMFKTHICGCCLENKKCLNLVIFCSRRVFVCGILCWACAALLRNMTARQFHQQWQHFPDFLCVWFASCQPEHFCIPPSDEKGDSLSFWWVSVWCCEIHVLSLLKVLTRA